MRLVSGRRETPAPLLADTLDEDGGCRPHGVLGYGNSDPCTKRHTMLVGSV